ncbi:hypothetical protein H0H81_003567 [Sphagnurus paluster]|uniref:Uncharacterized protein n=1 Tax=Sphagnurus paluster TaxID=117069 RepID=A0A9P7K2E2_9AGAR|nr:hypothetical protein H0H81_003567 [Sphagnurus paluster]
MRGSPSGSHLPLPALPSPPPPPSPPPQLTHSGQPQRNYVVPLWYQDVLPAPPVPSVQPDEPSEPEAPLLPHLAEKDLSFKDAPQSSLFGIFSHPPPWPFSNMSIFQFMKHINSNTTIKSLDDTNRLVKDVFQAPDFDPKHLDGFDAHRENQRLDEAIKDTTSSPFSWKEERVLGELLRVNYTTYDIRRASDTISPRTHCHVMVCSPKIGPNTHPFWYAQVLGVFHADVLHRGPRSDDPDKRHHMQFLWVRWLGLEPGYRSGCQFARLPKVGFVPDSNPYTFGFLNPSDVIRGAHIIPAFAADKTLELLAAQHTVARALNSTKDWVNFYINIFVDRDMYFWYIGYGIGHIPVPSDNAPEHKNLDNTHNDNEMDIYTAPAAVTLGGDDKGDGDDEDDDEDNEDNNDDEDDKDRLDEDEDGFDNDDDNPDVGYGGL